MSKITDNMTLRVAKENEKKFVAISGKKEMSSILLGRMKSANKKHLNFRRNLMMS